MEFFESVIWIGMRIAILVAAQYLYSNDMGTKEKV